MTARRTYPRKKVLEALEKVFAAEINGLLPFQSKAKIYKELADNDLLAEMNRKFGTCPFAVIVTGWCLTHAGRLMYCANCGDGE